MYTKIIKKPVLTEKLAVLQERENKFAFFVDVNSNKTEIKKAVQEKFNVKVLKVAIIRQNGKKKQMTVKSAGKTIRTSGKRSDFKKAILTLHPDSTIDFVGGEVVS
jgi:large subunit ribosomal protein L23